MARIRSIKPEFWTSEQVTDCSMQARLIFIGIWNFCDDSGIHPASIKRLKMQLIPSDDVSLEQIASWIKELIKADLLEEYDVNGKVYWRVTGFHHQRIDQPTYKHPMPNGQVPVPKKRRREEK